MKKVMLTLAMIASLQSFACEYVKDDLDQKIKELIIQILQYDKTFETEDYNENDYYWYLCGRAEALSQVREQLQDVQANNVP